MAPAFKYTEELAYWYLHLNETQQTAYDNFHAKLEASKLLVPGVDDKYTLLRFLKARQWDVEKAMVMYLKMAAWRQELNVDNLFDTYEFAELDAIFPAYPHFYHKLDKFGRPVYIELVGKTDCTKLAKLTTEKRLLDYHVFTWERFHKQLMPACTKLAAKPIVTATVILDLAGLGLGSFNMTTQRLLSALAHIDQDYYPESLGVMFIINTPFIFKTIWAFVYPMLEERTRKKIHVLGSDYKGHLLEVIPAENLLKMFGGTSEALNLKDSQGPWEACEEVKSKRWHPTEGSASKGALLPVAPEPSMPSDTDACVALKGQAVQAVAA